MFHTVVVKMETCISANSLVTDGSSTYTFASKLCFAVTFSLQVRRVKAILSHLMHCITSNTVEEPEAEAPPTFRPRAMSVHTVAQSKGKVQVAEEVRSYQAVL